MKLKLIAVGKINVQDIPKEKLYQGKKGLYLTYKISIDTTPDQFENNGAITVNQTKEEKDSKQPTVYLGNHKIVWMEVEDGDNGLPQRAAAPKAPQAYKPDPSEIDDLPF